MKILRDLTNASDMTKLGWDAYKGTVKNFSNEDANTALRNAFTEILGEGQDLVKVLRNSAKREAFFALMEEVISLPLADGLQNGFEGLVDYEALPLDAEKIYTIPNQDLFKISIVADGNADLRKQKIYNNKIQLTKFNMACAIMAEFDAWRCGQVDFAELTNRVGVSMAKASTNYISDAMHSAFDSLTTSHKITGTPTFQGLVDMISMLQRITGVEYCILGGQAQLTKLSGLDATAVASLIGAGNLSDAKKDEFGTMRRFGKFAGTTDMIELPDSPKVAGQEASALWDEVYIVPKSTAIVKFASFGEPIVLENLDANKRNDMTISYEAIQKVGIAVLTPVHFGIAKF